MATARAGGHTTKVQCPGHARPSRLGCAPCPCGSPRPSDLGPCASGLPVCLLPTSTARRPGGRGTPRASRAIAPGGPGRLESSWGLIPMQGGLKTFPGSPRSRADGSGRQSADPLSWRRPSQRLTDAMDGSGDEPAIDTGASQRRVGCHPSGRSQGPEPDPRGPKAPDPVIGLADARRRTAKTSLMRLPRRRRRCRRGGTSAGFQCRARRRAEPPRAPSGGAR